MRRIQQSCTHATAAPHQDSRSPSTARRRLSPQRRRGTSLRTGRWPLRRGRWAHRNARARSIRSTARRLSRLKHNCRGVCVRIGVCCATRALWCISHASRSWHKRTAQQPTGCARGIFARNNRGRRLKVARHVALAVPALRAARVRALAALPLADAAPSARARRPLSPAATTVVPLTWFHSRTWPQHLTPPEPLTAHVWKNPADTSLAGPRSDGVTSWL